MTIEEFLAAVRTALPNERVLVHVSAGENYGASCAVFRIIRRPGDRYDSSDYVCGGNTPDEAVAEIAKWKERQTESMSERMAIVRQELAELESKLNAGRVE